MTRENDRVLWLYGKSPLLFELLYAVAVFLASSSTWRLHDLGQPVVPHIFGALFMGLFVTLGARFTRWKKEEKFDHD